MAFIVFILLAIVLLLYILFSKRKKRAVLISLGIIVLYHLYVTYTCGPDPRDVRVMKPMANAISDYIVKHGIPKSLSEIPGLPYKLEGCKKKEGFPYSLFCTFNKDYSVEFADDPNHRYYSVNFYAPNSSTGMDIDFKVVDGNRLILEKSTPRLPNPHIYSSKITGICNPMRQ